MKSTQWLAALLLLVGLRLRAAEAQIYEWVDEEAGVRHYTTSLQQIPEAARPKARLFVEPGQMSRIEDEAAISKSEQRLSPDAAAEAEAREEASLTEAFRAGVEAGYIAACEEAPQPGPVEPPVVIFEMPPPVVLPPYDPSGLYYRPPYQDRASVPFDDGRSLGLTRRQQLQERRRIERGR